MPISSGATGRVAVGVDAAIAWTPDGLTKDAKLHHRSNDSYLKRYLESTQRLRQGGEATGEDSPQGGEDAGATEKPGVSDGESEDKLSSDKCLKKSKTCTLL